MPKPLSLWQLDQCFMINIAFEKHFCGCIQEKGVINQLKLRINWDGMKLEGKKRKDVEAQGVLRYSGLSTGSIHGITSWQGGSQR